MLFIKKIKHILRRLKTKIQDVYIVLKYYNFFQDIIHIFLDTKNKEYVLGNYNTCPFCDSNDFSTDDHNWEDDLYIRTFNCKTCDRMWEETYILISMIEL